MSHQTIRIDTDARGVATLWLARADKHNALSAQMIGELTQAAAQLGQLIAAIARMESGMAMPSSRQVMFQPAQLTLRSSLRPAPVSATSTTRSSKYQP